MIKTKYLIIGGGISGLQLASKLKEDYIVVEKQDSLGGYCNSFYQDGFVWDYGGHFFHGNKVNIEEFKKRDGVILKNKITKIYFNGRYIDFPFQNHINQLDEENYKYCLDTYNKRNINDNKDNFLSKLYSNYGEGIVDLFLRPYNEKLYACDLATLDVDAMGRFFPSSPINITNNVKGYNDTYYASSNGAVEYIKMILEKINIKKIMINCECYKIDCLKKIAHTSNGDIGYDVLVNTIPFNKFLNIIDEQKYSITKSVFNYNKVAIFNLGFDKANNIPYHWIYYPNKELSFYRVGFYNNIFNNKNMSLYVEVGLKPSENINEEKKLQVILDDLKKVGVIENHKLVSYKCVVADPAYVHITKDSLELVKKLKVELKEKDIYSIGRYGNWTYCSMGECVEEANKLAKEII